MKKRKIGFELVEYEAISDLEREDRILLKAAIQARNGAHAPYSKFKVGAALSLKNGEVVIGSNQENASFPAGLCAERVAVFQAGARFPGAVIERLAVSVASELASIALPTAPCGICRQSLLEYESKQGLPIKVLMMGESGPVYECPSISDMLPLAFDRNQLPEK